MGFMAYNSITMTEKDLSNPMTVIALVNGMIGGIILIMPLLSLRTGMALIAPTCIVSGIFSYFSCQLCLKHLRNYKDLDEAIYRHFGNRKVFKIGYDLSIVISMSVLLVLYFDLICKQWEGMTSQSILIPILNALALVPLVYVMKKFHFGASLLAYGILSVIGYCIFLTWMWITSPPGQKHVQQADAHFLQMGSALAQGFAIQGFFIPIMKQNPNRASYSKILMITYAIGIAVYTFIGYSGAESLINRSPPGGNHPETIEDYFGEKQWEVILLEILYLVHLYSAFPEFLLIAKKRFFGVFNWPEPKNINLKEIIYVGSNIGVCFLFKMIGVKVDVLVELNGSVLGFLFAYLIPVGIHVKCKYFTKSEDRHYRWEDQKQIQPPKTEMAKQDVEVQINSPDSAGRKHHILKMDLFNKDSNEFQTEQTEQAEKNEQNQQVVAKELEGIDEGIDEGKMKESKQEEGDFEDCCDIECRSKAQQICEIVMIVGMLGVGIATLIFTLYFVAQGSGDSTL